MKGQRILVVSADILVEMCKTPPESEPTFRLLRVVKNALPDDAKIVAIRSANLGMDNSIAVVLESASWSGSAEDEDALPSPEVTAITHTCPIGALL